MKAVSAIPLVGRLNFFKMKLLLAIALCVSILFMTTVKLSTGYPSVLKTKVSFRQNETISNSLDVNGQDVADLETLRLVHVLFRHGDRTPIDRYPKDPYNSRKYFPEGWGKLTEMGKLMQFRLGQYIRQRYDGFLSRVYTSEEIYVQSSDVDRTIMSAMANLAGMWPATPSDLSYLPQGGQQQFVPVHTLSSSVDNKIGYTRACPKYDKELLEVGNLDAEKAFNKEHQSIYDELTQHTGMDVISYSNASDIYDTLFVQKCHNLTLPDWSTDYFPDKLLSITEHWIKSFTFNDNLRRLRAGPLITEFMRNMKRLIGNPSEEEKKILEKLFHTPFTKFYVYSGHDTTLSAILDALGVFDGKLSPYASSVYIELHQNEVDDYFVKVFYRPDIQQSAYELKLGRCKSNPCKFNDFMGMMTGYIMDEKQWEKECTL